MNRRVARFLIWTRDRRTSLTLFFTLLVVVVAGFALRELLREVHLEDVRSAIGAISLTQIILALVLTAASYVVLTGYDVLALHAIGKPQPWWRAALASFTAYCLSHNLGFAPVTGGAARWRAYQGTSVNAPDIARIVVIAGVTFWLGIFLLLGVFLVTFPGALRLQEQQLHYGAQAALGAVILAGILVYLFACTRQKGPLYIMGWRLPVPTLKQALIQFGLAATDIAIASAALLVLLPSSTWNAYPDFVVAYVVAMVVALITHAPGGLGVFEAVILVTLPDVDKVQLVSALVLYRVIYYWLPLLLAGGLMGAHELKIWGRRTYSDRVQPGAATKH